MKDQCLLVLTFRLLIVACFSYLVSVQICEIVTVSSLCPSRNWRDVVLSTLCSALGTRVSRRICVSASTRLSSTLSQTVQSRFKKFKMNVQDWYLNILNTKMCPSLQILCLMYKSKFVRRSEWFCNTFFSLKVDKTKNTWRHFWRRQGIQLFIPLDMTQSFFPDLKNVVQVR